MTAYTPIYNLPYVEASDLVASYPTVSEELAENVETAIAGSGGLSLIDEESFSAVSSVSLNNVFSATYANYRLIIALTGSGTSVLSLRLRASGTDTSSNYVGCLVRFSSAGATSYETAVTNRMKIGVVRTGDLAAVDLLISEPYISRPTRITGNHVDNSEPGVAGGTQTDNSAFDGITIYPDSGNITGIVRIYGYKGA